MTDTTTLQLSHEDALLFVAFQKRYAFMKLLETIGAFEIKSGSITIHFDNIGGIGAVDKLEKYKV